MSGRCLEDALRHDYSNEQYLVAGGVSMGLLTLLLSFVPFVNGVLGGFWGGIRAASPRTALLAWAYALLPVAAALFVVHSIIGLPVLGAPHRPSTMMLIATACAGMLLGALLGGLVGASGGLRPSTRVRG